MYAWYAPLSNVPPSVAFVNSTQGVSTNGCNLIFSQSKNVESSNSTQGSPSIDGPEIWFCKYGTSSIFKDLDGLLPSSQYTCHVQSKFSFAAPVIKNFFLKLRQGSLTITSYLHSLSSNLPISELTSSVEYTIHSSPYLWIAPIKV